MRKDYRKLNDKELEEIYRQFRQRTIQSMAIEYGTSITQMTNIYSQCISRLKQEISLRERMPEYKYWNTEEEIFESLELNYEPSQLTGWEREQYEKLCG